MVIDEMSAMSEDVDVPVAADSDPVSEDGAQQPEPALTNGSDPPEVRTGPPKPGMVVVALAVVLTASIVVVFFGVFAYGLSGLQEHRSQSQLYAQFRGLLDPSSITAPSIGGHIAQGTPVALLNAPAAGIRNVTVVEGTSSGDLLAGPGHLSDTPLPGQGGEAILVGKSTTAGAPFADLSRLRAGDLITVRTGQGLFRFTVRGEVSSDAGQRAIPADEGRLVLVTSGSARLSGRPSRVIGVEATLRGKAVAAPAHRPRDVAASQLPGHNDPAAWPLVFLWMGGLVLASAAVWWLWFRWGLLRTWLVGAPVLLALLWGLSNEVMRLLPNTY